MRSARLDVLEALSDAMSVTGPRVDTSQLNRFGSFLDGVVKLLGEDESLSPELRGYILKLVQQIRVAVEEFETTGRFEYAEALLQLWVALTAATGQSKTAKSKWKKFSETI